MELRSSQLATITTSIPSGNWREKLLFTNSTNKSVKLPDYRKSSSYTGSRKLKFIGSGFSASGTTRFSSLAVKATVAESKTKDDNLVYVAGATGKVGSRTVRELLKLGFNVRAGVRSAQRAESLVQSVKQMKSDADTSSEGPKPIEKLELVECDLEKPEQIKPALGNASIIICCIGASEKEISDITGPYRIDYQATKNLIDAATAAKVNHFILLTSLGTNKVGFPAAILNLFWGVLIWKRKAEEALLASGLPYTIVRPGGMERPTDAYKETHNMTLSEEDTLFGGQVSNLQVAELLAYMATNRSVSYCKVVEVIAETTAPLTPMGDLLAKIPSQRIEVKPLKKEDAAEKPLPTPPTTAISEPPAPTPPVEEEPTEEKTKTTPLSPYTMYEDLKPPVSPIPLPPSKAVSMNEVPSSNQVSNILETPSPGTPVETEIALPEVVKSRPLSPYTAYEDLKPPVSPTPLSPSESVSINEIPSSKQTDNILETPSTPVETEFTLPEVVKSRPLSPFAAYEDLKPPSSPSPIANGPKELTPEVVPEITGGNGVANVASNSNEQDPPLVVNYRLSPYVAYEDLKPPTSPSPVPKK